MRSLLRRVRGFSRGAMGWSRGGRRGLALMVVLTAPAIVLTASGVAAAAQGGLTAPGATQARAAAATGVHASRTATARSGMATAAQAAHETANRADAIADVKANTVPSPPSGWSTQFSDDFNGSARTAPDSSWMYDTG